MCCFTQNILTLRLSVGGQTHGRTDGRTENIYSIFRDKLLLLGEHGLTRTSTSNFKTELLISTPTGLFLAYFHATLFSHFHYRFHNYFFDRYYPDSQNPLCNLNFCGILGWIGDDLECVCCVLRCFCGVLRWIGDDLKRICCFLPCFVAFCSE